MLLHQSLFQKILLLLPLPPPLLLLHLPPLLLLPLLPLLLLPLLPLLLPPPLLLPLPLLLPPPLLLPLPPPLIPPLPHSLSIHRIYNFVVLNHIHYLVYMLYMKPILLMSCILHLYIECEYYPCYNQFVNHIFHK